MKLAPFILKWSILHNFPILRKIYRSPEAFTEGKTTAHDFNVNLQQLQKCLVVDTDLLYFLDYDICC